MDVAIMWGGAHIASCIVSEICSPQWGYLNSRRDCAMGLSKDNRVNYWIYDYYCTILINLTHPCDCDTLDQFDTLTQAASDHDKAKISSNFGHVLHLMDATEGCTSQKLWNKWKNVIFWSFSIVTCWTCLILALVTCDTEQFLTQQWVPWCVMCQIDWNSTAAHVLCNRGPTLSILYTRNLGLILYCFFNNN